MIILKNKGEIDIDLIRVMGVSAKESGNPFGIFGTGLKYAISVFLREGIEFSLWIGANKYEFFTEEKMFREQSFAMCKMRGPHDSIDLPFVTSYGRNWDIWQAYREIDCNCMDEGGEIYNADSVRGEAGYTIFCVQDIDTRGIFLRDSTAPLLFSNDDIEIYEGESECIYYRGVRAKDLDRPSLHTYNIKRACDLTEDRLLCYDFQVERTINESIAQAGNANKSLIKSVITAKPHHYESTLTMQHDTRVAPGAVFKEIAHEAGTAINSGARQYIADHTPKRVLTREEECGKFKKQLQDFCESHDLAGMIIEEEGRVHVKLIGEIITDTKRYLCDNHGSIQLSAA